MLLTARSSTVIMGIKKMKIHMITPVFSPTCRLFRQKWFYFSAIATIFCLWADLGTENWQLLQSFRLAEGGADLTTLLFTALTGTSASLSLPLLAALPFSANAGQEIRSRAAYFFVFRCGYSRYLTGQLLALSLAACLSQLLGLIFFCLLLTALGASFQTALTSSGVGTLLLCRLLTAVSFAHLGCIGALVTKDSACALVTPVAFSLFFTMLQERFFSDTLNFLLLPALALAFLIVSLFLNAILLHLEVRRHA